ncbi:hypothetical protein C4D60_Mb10t00860 [Musa balbisiana]|uniref:Uncharacterized protein n=1 Tax=Musa balbisiana TaxID=52838 RepID=A0A4S8ITR0_MUSBA|nr:hypothetical protein C4D60_Mb10t00860 [Musa balbisiana]
MRTASSYSHPCPTKSSGEAVSLSTATATAACTLAKAGSGGGIFLRRPLIAAASSPSANGDSARDICAILLQNIMFLVQKRLFCILPCNKSTIHLSSYEFCSLFSFSTAKDQISDHKSNFTVVNSLQSCELSSAKAAKKAKCRTCDTKSSSSSLSIEFFKQSGWSDAQVMKLMQREPRLLRANVETILKPRMRSLQDMGFSDTEIVQLVSSCPHVLNLRDIQPRINFWSLFSSFSTAKDQISDHKSNFTVVNPLQSCELSSEKAAKTAKCRTCDTKSSSSSLSIEFFKQSGWSDAQVMKLMQREPRLLRANVETILKPRMRSLQDMGFSDTEIVQLVSSCPHVLNLHDIQSRINFWRSLLGSNERLIKACRRNMESPTLLREKRLLFFFGDCGVSSVNDGCLPLDRETATVGGVVFPSRLFI